MNKNVKTLLKRLKAEGWDYREDEDVIMLCLEGENICNLEVAVKIEEDMPLICIGACDIAKFKGKEKLAFAVCNKLNDTGGMVKFVVENEARISAYYITFFPEDRFYDYGFMFINTFFEKVDEAYPLLMKALYA